MPRKNDLVLQLWLDRRRVAAASLFLEEHTSPPHSMSEVVRVCFNEYIDSMVEKGLIILPSTEQATEILSRRFKKDPNPSGQALRALRENLKTPEEFAVISEAEIEKAIKVFMKGGET